ncbi:MAG: ATP-binding protein [Desulfovibrionaceae bacterium]
MRTSTSFRTKIFLCMLLAIGAALSLPALYVHLSLDAQLLADAESQALREAKLTATLLADYRPGGDLNTRIHSLDAPGVRISLMDAQGQVLADSSLDKPALANLDNHADRPEFQAALAQGQGISTRYSNTLQSSTIYAAVRMKDGTIVRVAVPYAALEARLSRQLNNILWVGGAAVALALLLAWILSKKLERSLAHMVNVVEAISLGKYRRRLHAVPGSEFTTLAAAVNRMAENIDIHITTVADQKGQLLSILETMHDGVLVLDNKGRIRSCNRALLELFPAAQDNLGCAVVEAIPVPALQEAVETLLRSADSPEHAEPLPENAPMPQQRLQLDFAGARTLDVHMARPLNPSPSLGAVVVFHDISEVMRLERIRRDFVTNVSHELRTPLTAIQGYAETLIHLNTLPEESRRFVEIIHKHGSYLGRMVEELLSLARLENDDDHFPLQPTNVYDCVQGAVALCLDALHEKRVHVQVDMPETLMVHGSHTHLLQVMRNLLENACRYSPPDSAIVVRGSIQHRKAQLSVSDTGPGIPPQELGRIFERFYRVDKHRTSPLPGGTVPTGLGLAICKHIVERHHGHIWAESPAPPAATCFTFILPLA